MPELIHFTVFFFQTLIVVLAILATLLGIVAILTRGKDPMQGKLAIKSLNKKYNKVKANLLETLTTKHQTKKRKKTEKKQKKRRNKKENDKARLFVINFNGDIKASQTTSLAEEINGVLLVAEEHDEVLLRLESPGGMVPGYGLAASQLVRLKDAGIKLTIAVDKVAASGGYMMACVADHLIAAPFAIIGSIGVVAQLPNFNKLLKKHDIDYEMLTAGEYKRTLTMLGENTKEGREKMQSHIDETHELFKTFIHDHRPIINLDKVATGEYWFAKQAHGLKLVDSLQTSESYLLNARENFDLYHLSFHVKKPFLKQLSEGAESTFYKLFAKTPT